MSDKELKCENVKGDLNDSPHVELAKVLQNLALINSETVHLGQQMQFFTLRYILRYKIVFQNKFFSFVSYIFGMRINYLPVQFRACRIKIC